MIHLKNALALVLLTFIIVCGCGNGGHLEVIPEDLDCTQTSILAEWIGKTSNCRNQTDKCARDITATFQKEFISLSCEGNTLVSGVNMYLGDCHGQINQESQGRINVRYNYRLSGNDSLQIWIECRSFSCEYLLARTLR